MAPPTSGASSHAFELQWALLPLPPDARGYQKRVIPVIQQHSGSVDKFLGDGILASFGAVAASETYAADALQAPDAIIDEMRAWHNARVNASLSAPRIGMAVASGEVLFGAVGDETRLEYTIIGDAVNFAAKLEKHTKIEQVIALTDATTFELAISQGYGPLSHAPHQGGVTDGPQVHSRRRSDQQEVAGSLKRPKANQLLTWE